MSEPIGTAALIQNLAAGAKGSTGSPDTNVSSGDQDADLSSHETPSILADLEVSETTSDDPEAPESQLAAEKTQETRSQAKPAAPADKKIKDLEKGMRQFQVERDRTRKELEAVRGEFGELRSNWNALDKAWNSRGIEGLVDLLEGREGAHADYVKKHVDRARLLEDASPDQRKALLAEESAESRAREIQQMRKENETFKKEIQEREERAEMKALESRVYPAFDKHRFQGQLGDADAEHMFDTMLWDTTMKRLEPYEEKGVDISPALVEREFKAAAQAVRKYVSVQAEKKAAKAVERQKNDATEHVQTKVRQGYRPNSAAKEANDLLNSGRTADLLKNWGKFGGVFGGKRNQ